MPKFYRVSEADRLLLYQTVKDSEASSRKAIWCRTR